MPVDHQPEGLAIELHRDLAAILSAAGAGGSPKAEHPCPAPGAAPGVIRVYCWWLREPAALTSNGFLQCRRRSARQYAGNFVATRVHRPQIV